MGAALDAARDRILAKRRRLKRDEVGRFAHQFDVGAILPLENLPNEDELSLFIPVAQAIAHQAAIERGGELGAKSRT
jgi:hypothetical protein